MLENPTIAKTTHSPAEESRRRLEAGLQKGLKAKLLQLVRADQAKMDVINMFWQSPSEVVHLPGMGHRKLSVNREPTPMEYESCKRQMIDFIENWQPEELIEGGKPAQQRGRKKHTKRQDYAKSPELVRDFLDRLHKNSFVDKNTAAAWKEIYQGRFRDSKTMIDESAPRMNWTGLWVEFREMYQFVRFAGLFVGNRWKSKQPGEWMDSQWLFQGDRKTASDANSGWGNAKPIDEQKGIILHRAITEVVLAHDGNKEALDEYYFTLMNYHYPDRTY